MNWIEVFNLNSFCNTTRINLNYGEKFKGKLRTKFPEIFSEGLGKCKKVKVSFRLKENITPIFRPKRRVPFLCVKEIGVLSKTEL